MPEGEVNKLQKRWKQIAEQVTNEENPEKLSELTQELLRELDKVMNSRAKTPKNSPSKDSHRRKSA